jgi:hypothetical protein
MDTLTTPPPPKEIRIAPPNIQTLPVRIVGTAPLVIAAFSAKAQNAMKAKHEAGSTARSRRTREARDFRADCANALHVSNDGWHGFPAVGLKLAMVSACRTTGFTMTAAKLGLFVQPDGLDRVTGAPLLRIHSTEPYEETILPTRNATGVFDLRARPMWRQWHMDVRVSFDADLLTATDIANLLARAGLQVGIGEGRADSKKSCGAGWGSFRVEAMPSD